MPLNGKWFTGFKGTPEEKAKLDETIRNHRYVLDILTKVLENDLRELEENKKDDYSIPNWSHLQADRNGAIRTIKSLLKLTKLEGPQ